MLTQTDFLIVGLLRAFNVLMCALTLREDAQVYNISQAYGNVETLFMVRCFKEHTFGNAVVLARVQ